MIDSAKAHESRQVLHLVYAALPEQSGYSIRTTYVVKATARIGMRPLVSWRPSLHTRSRRARVLKLTESYTEDGVSYVVLPSVRARICRAMGMIDRWLRPGTGEHAASRYHKRLFSSYVRWIRNKAQSLSLVHAHSPGSVGLSGLEVAKRLGLPLIYEVRGFWGMSEAARRGAEPDVVEVIQEDLAVAHRASAVIVLSSAMKSLLVGEGVPEAKVFVVPNGVDTKKFIPKARDPELEAKLGFANKVVFGCATNVRRIEGLEVLVAALPKILSQVPSAALLVIGDGDYLESLKQQVRSLGLESHVMFTGKVPHSDVTRYYSMIDIMVLPRLPEPVCMYVPPLKPLEAMALEKPVIASDLPASSEIVEDEKTGLLFKAGDTEACAEACVRLGTSEARRQQMGKNARKWVVENRSWAKIAAKYESIYITVDGRE